MAAAAQMQPALNPERRGPAFEKFETDLAHRVVGQDEAVHAITDAYELFSLHLNPPNRPVVSMLFLGPTGVGKTYVIECAAELLFGTPRAVVKVDCGEFQHSHEIAKLIGSPPGYIGHRESHARLSQYKLEEFHREGLKLTFLLFDEIEKADYALWNLLLGILDKAIVNLGDGTRVDMQSCAIFMTSNLGGKQMVSCLGGGIGFQDMAGDELSRLPTKAARENFSPEFINRIDRIVTFQPLTDVQMQAVLERELVKVQEQLLSIGGGVILNITQEARQALLAEGTDLRYGARHLRRTVERHLLHPIARLLSSGQVKAGETVKVGVLGPALSFAT